MGLYVHVDTCRLCVSPPRSRRGTFARRVCRHLGALGVRRRRWLSLSLSCSSEADLRTDFSRPPEVPDGSLGGRGRRADERSSLEEQGVEGEASPSEPSKPCNPWTAVSAASPTQRGGRGERRPPRLGGGPPQETVVGSSPGGPLPAFDSSQREFRLTCLKSGPFWTRRGDQERGEGWEGGGVIDTGKPQKIKSGRGPPAPHAASCGGFDGSRGRRVRKILLQDPQISKISREGPGNSERRGREGRLSSGNTA